ncbi:MAG: hypothetical protein ABIS26_00920 [Candidatus Paceibacterota bacterium]
MAGNNSRNRLSFSILLVFLFSFSFFSYAQASNPTTPIVPGDNIMDPGDPGTPWGGCGPTDSNCYVTLGGNASFDTLSVTGNSTLADVLPQTAATSTSGIVNTTIGSSAGYNVSIANGTDGFPRISYFVPSNSYALNYVRCINVNCTSPTITEVVSSTYGGDYGGYNLAIGSDGFARIVYTDEDEALQMVRCLDTDCTTKNINQIVDNSNYPGEYGAEITFGTDGFPRIAYSDANSPYANHFVRCTDADCTSPIDTIVGGENNYGYALLTIDASDGFARLVYEDADLTLKLIRCTDANCTTPVITVIDSDTASNPGYYGVMIRMGSDGYPRIVYLNNDSNDSLNYIVCTDDDCTSPTQTQLIEDTGSIYDGFGFALRSGNLASITYEDASGLPHVINCSNNSCSSFSDVTIDDLSPNSMRRGASLALGSDGLPRVVYTDAATGVYYARLLNFSGDAVTAGNDIGGESNRFNNIYGQIINADSLYLNGTLAGIWNKSGNDIINQSLTDSLTIGSTGYGMKLISSGDVVIRAGQENGLGANKAIYYDGSTQYFRDSTGLATTYMTILPSGNVGIGTTSPGYKLDVNGTVRVSGNLYLPNYSTIMSGASTTNFYTRNTALWMGNFSADVSGTPSFYDQYSNKIIIGNQNYATNVNGNIIAIGMNQVNDIRTVYGAIVIGNGASSGAGNTGYRSDLNIVIGNSSGTGINYLGTSNTGKNIVLGNSSVTASTTNSMTNTTVIGNDIEFTGSNAVVFNPSQSVLIGTTTANPGANLEVANSAASGNVTVARLSTLRSTWSAGEEIALDFTQSGTAVARMTAEYFTGVDWGTNFYTTNGTLNASPTLTLRGSGFVGIGTDLPTDLLSLTTGNLRIGASTDVRGTTAGTNQVILFDGTAPVGTLTNGISLYSTAGELRVMDSAGNATLLSPHENTNNYWIFDSQNSETRKSLVIDMELMMKDINRRLGFNYVHETILDENGDPIPQDTLPLSGWSISEDGTLTVKKVQTDELCVGQTCVTEDQLKQLLQNGNTELAPQPASPPAPEQTPPPETEVIDVTPAPVDNTIVPGQDIPLTTDTTPAWEPTLSN